MTYLPYGWQLAIKFLAQLANQFTFRPGEPMIVERDRKHVLLMPAIALDLIRVTAIAAITLGSEAHTPQASPPCVSIAHSKMAMASASLSSVGLKPRLWAASIMACLFALP